MKILNLYAGIGGNRKLWGTHEITAIEKDKEIANIYKQHFPNDNIIIGNAHEYLLNHFKEYDFIWSSPPCQSHSSFRQNICVRFRSTKPVFWSNKELADIEIKKDNLRSAQIKDLEKHHGYDLSRYKIKNKRQILRNCVYPKLGLNIFEQFINKGEL